MPSGALSWTLEGFLDRLESWGELQSPQDELRLTVMIWIMTRYDDPYQGVRRENGFPNLWFGTVPHSGDGCGNVVTCSYWIEEVNRSVRCDSFATLSLPV